GVGQVVAETAADLGEHPPRRAAIADGCHDRGRVLGRHARNEEVPQGDVGPLQLVLGGQDVGGDGRGGVGDDLGGHEQVEGPQGRFMAPVAIINAHDSQAVTLPLTAPIVTPVPVWMATGPAVRTASRRSLRSASASPAMSAARSTAKGSTAAVSSSRPTARWPMNSS